MQIIAWRFVNKNSRVEFTLGSAELRNLDYLLTRSTHILNPMHIKIGFFLLLATGVAVPFLSSTARSSLALESAPGGSAKSSHSMVRPSPPKLTPERKTLLEELSKVCVEASKDRDANKAKLECDCLVRYHETVSQDRYIKIAIEAYSGRGNFNSPKISDETSIVLNNDADALEKCEKNPSWRGDR